MEGEVAPKMFARPGCGIRPCSSLQDAHPAADNNLCILDLVLNLHHILSKHLKQLKVKILIYSLLILVVM